MSSIIDDMINKTKNMKGVEGIIISDVDGIPIKSTLEEDITYYYSTCASMFVKTCIESMKELIKEDVTLIRMRTKLNEIIISPEKDFIFIVVQKIS